MNYYYKPTGQVISRFQVLSMTGLNVETACVENLQEVGVYPLIDEMREELLDNPEPIFVEEGGIFYKRNSTELIETGEAKTKAFAHFAKNTEAEFERLTQNAGLGPLTVVFFYLFGENLSSDNIPGLDLHLFREYVIEKLNTLLRIPNAETTEQIKQLIEETVQS